ncbi:MarR family transcriptional regulator [Pseudoflavonifractor sp.]|jgi:DNA-binding MarR family transcriptional regulator|uniref:MarR family transcriptional regulator n=1 Tax=Pseudoflavonifractor sp. TaxID=1980281 RepID=UPI003D8FB326
MTKHQLLIQQFRRYANNVDLITRAHSTEILNGYGNSELNCIDCIGRAKRPTASSISKEMDITRSGISKVLRRLVSKGAIQSYQMPSNQKEIYYCLTPYGQEIFKQHRLRHQNWEDRDRMFFQSLSSEMLDTALQFMNIYNGYLEMKVAELSEQANKSLNDLEPQDLPEGCTDEGVD